MRLYLSHCVEENRLNYGINCIYSPKHTTLIFVCVSACIPKIAHSSNTLKRTA